MKAMVYAALFGLLSAAGCSSQKRFETAPPFRVSGPTSQAIAAGRESGGVTGELTFRFTAEEPGSVILDSLYFRGRVLTPMLAETETGVVVRGQYPLRELERPDLVMHADSLQEVGNQPPAPLPGQKVLPFELERDQAVIMYHLRTDATPRYYRIEGIADKPVRAMPGRPQ